MRFCSKRSSHFLVNSRNHSAQESKGCRTGQKQDRLAPFRTQYGGHVGACCHWSAVHGGHALAPPQGLPGRICAGGSIKALGKLLCAAGMCRVDHGHWLGLWISPVPHHFIGQTKEPHGPAVSGCSYNKRPGRAVFVSSAQAKTGRRTNSSELSVRLEHPKGQSLPLSRRQSSNS